MELRTRRLMVALGGSFLLSLGVLAACSDNSGFTALPGSGTAVDAGKKPTTTSDSGDDGNEYEHDLGRRHRSRLRGCSEAPAHLGAPVHASVLKRRRRRGQRLHCDRGRDQAGGMLRLTQKIGSHVHPCEVRPDDGLFPRLHHGQVHASTRPVDGGGREWPTLACRSPVTALDGGFAVLRDQGSEVARRNPTADTSTFEASRRAATSSTTRHHRLFVARHRAARPNATTGEIQLCGSDDDCDQRRSLATTSRRTASNFTGVCKMTIR